MSVSKCVSVVKAAPYLRGIELVSNQRRYTGDDCAVTHRHQEQTSPSESLGQEEGGRREERGKGEREREILRRGRDG